jgi:hypothetical protein
MALPLVVCYRIGVARSDSPNKVRFQCQNPHVLQGYHKSGSAN